MQSMEEKMSMGGMGSQNSTSQAHSCKISMLWNWYTIDTCFIAKSWHNNTRGKFAGSCIGCFGLVVVAQWLNKIARQFDIEIGRREKAKYYAKSSNCFVGNEDASEDDITESSRQELEKLANESGTKSTLIALKRTLSHGWYFQLLRVKLMRRQIQSKDPFSYSPTGPYEIYPSLPTHILRVSIFVLQWGLSYIIMLLFMYYNGYIIISCIIGALVGRFLFNYEPLVVSNGNSTSDFEVAHDRETNDRKCCM
ncbi:CTR3 (YLR411W) [Zygosaccharomyces parabailii]|nr:CTR3 (YLR411W) [Zygosaccharomyces parabailii]CDH17164.1 related to Copper transport protein CTR3 [Zygosaccharomyces bailii ISA1307]